MRPDGNRPKRLCEASAKAKEQRMKRGNILVKILTAIRDNPGLRPSELYRLPEMAAIKLGPQWLQTCERHGYIVDNGAIARKRAWDEYKDQHPEPLPGPPEYQAWVRTFMALSDEERNEWYAANPPPELPAYTEEEAADAEKAYKAWYRAGPARIHPSIYITARGLTRIEGPLAVHPRKQYEFEFYENELGRVGAVLDGLNEGRLPRFWNYIWSRVLHEEQVEDGDSPLYVVKMKLNAEAFEVMKKLEHDLHGGGFSLEK